MSFKRIKTRKITRLKTTNRQKACKFTSFYLNTHYIL